MIGTTGTSLMTLFSYSASVILRQNLNVPVLLSAWIQHRLPQNNKRFALPMGWAGHFVLGNAWYIIYQYMMHKTKIKPHTVNGLLFGVLSGGIAIVSWRMLFKMDPKPPKINYKLFYLQLFMAHVVNITASTALTGKLTDV